MVSLYAYAGLWLLQPQLSPVQRTNQLHLCCRTVTFTYVASWLRVSDERRFYFPTAQCINESRYRGHAQRFNLSIHIWRQ